MYEDGDMIDGVYDGHDCTDMKLMLMSMGRGGLGIRGHGVYSFGECVRYTNGCSMRMKAYLDADASVGVYG